MQPKSPSQIKAMRAGGRILAQVLAELKAATQPGVTTNQLAKLASQSLKKLGGKPAFLGYRGFPDVICISVNDQVVHGIPSTRVLKANDVVGLDFGVNYQGLITDAAITVVAGQATSPVKRLIRATNEALAAGIKAVRTGGRVGDISAAIEARLRADKLGIIEALVGHGVGKYLHEAPEVPNFGKAGRGTKLKSGMTIAIEPMATLGDKQVYLDRDGWTIRTADNSLAAHFEHTVLVTDTGAEILTIV